MTRPDRGGDASGICPDAELSGDDPRAEPDRRVLARWEHQRRDAFTSVYSTPPRQPDGVQTTSRTAAGVRRCGRLLDGGGRSRARPCDEIETACREWVATEWPFGRVAYPGRDVPSPAVPAAGTEATKRPPTVRPQRRAVVSGRRHSIRYVGAVGSVQLSAVRPARRLRARRESCRSDSRQSQSQWGACRRGARTRPRADCERDPADPAREPLKSVTPGEVCMYVAGPCLRTLGESMSVGYQVSSDHQLARLLQIGIVLEEVVEARAYHHHEELDEELEQAVLDLLEHAETESAEHRRQLESLIDDLEADTVPFEEIEMLVEPSTKPTKTSTASCTTNSATRRRHTSSTTTSSRPSRRRRDILYRPRAVLAVLSDIREDEADGVEDVTRPDGGQKGTPKGAPEWMALSHATRCHPDSRRRVARSPPVEHKSRVRTKQSSQTTRSQASHARLSAIARLARHSRTTASSSASSRTSSTSRSSARRPANSNPLSTG